MKYLKKFKLFEDSEPRSDKSLNESRVINFPKENGNFIVIAGGPGAGKSFISKNLINLRNYKIVNVDNFRELMARKLGLDLGNPEDNMKILKMTHTTSDPRNRTVRHLKQFLKIPKDEDKLPNILFDAGGGQTNVMKTVHDLAKNLGYETTLVYVKTDLETALARNKKRERTLPDEMVVRYHDKVKSSVNVLEKIFDNVWVVDNTEQWDPVNRPTDRIEKIK